MRKKPAAATSWDTLSCWQQEFFDMHHPSPFYTSCEALAGTSNFSLASPGGIDRMTHRTMS